MSDPQTPRFSPSTLRLPKRGRIRLLLAAIFLSVILWHAVRHRGGPHRPPSGKAPHTLTNNKAAVDFLAGLAFDSLLPSEGFAANNGDTVRISTSASPGLQRRIYRLMVQYRPLCGAAVVYKPATGEVLAAVSYRNPSVASQLPECGNFLLWNGFPAASLFKIVTAAGAMQEGLIAPDDKISFNGSNHTLYRNQLNGRHERWSRQMTLREAFYRSVNPLMGIVGQSLLGEARLSRAAERFLFNDTIPFDLPVPPSRYEIPADAYQLAEVACGFNRRTTLTPLHAALIAGAIANGGKVKAPYLIREMAENGKTYYGPPETETFTLCSPEAARLTRDMMEDVVERGTGRKSFQILAQARRFKDFRLGGKTGSIDGENPKGRCDWFAGFAIPPEKPEEAIALGVVTLHGPFWTVHSSYIAAEAIRAYYGNL